MEPDALQWLLKHSASAYEDELHSAERLQDRIGFVVGIMITPLSWAFVYLVINFKGATSFSIPNVVFFWIPLAFAGFMLLASIALVAYTLLRGFFYTRIPPRGRFCPISRTIPNRQKHWRKPRPFCWTATLPR
uniref:Uncharacterized protein n=1 Tax=Candidatus Kentrum sp. DK TaxID=2126562 RepID=A0A450S8M5_9GAMM|nr:MAG: hypothetical protein BECKDK2373C_GA0170839_102115 [Candidatus Kentron sp. DK]